VRGLAARAEARAAGREEGLVVRGLIALVVIAAVVLCVVFIGRTSARPGGEAASPGPSQVNRGPTVVLPVKLALECQEATTLEDKLPDGKVIWKKGERNEGEAVKYLESTDKWVDEWLKANPDRKELKGKPGGLPGKASYVFETPRDDTYYVYLRAQWRDDCGNSVWVRVDDSPWINLEDENGMISEKNYKWAWHPLYLGGRPKGYELKKGQHTLWMCTREDGVKLHQWVISTDANPPIGGAFRKK